ncbi:MAG: hypothetical protein QM632_00455 [Micrococcaceae bacterium]
MNNQLQNTLTNHAHSAWQSNPAMHQIINGYAEFHAVLAIVGGLFLLITGTCSIKGWARFKRVDKIDRFKWPFSKKVYFCFASLFTVIALLLALVTVANITNVTNPLPGFTDSIPSMTTDSYNQQLYVAFNDWIVSGNSTPPSLVQQRIHHRRVFHTIRVIGGVVLLVLFTMLSLWIWKRLIQKREASETKWTLKDVTMLASGVIVVAIALFMMVVVMANLQSAVVPIANTLQFG